MNWKNREILFATIPALLLHLSPLFSPPLQIVLLLCGKVEKGSCKLLQLQAEMEMATISCCSHNGNEIKIHAEVCVSHAEQCR